MEHAREISIRQHMPSVIHVFLNMFRTPFPQLMERSISLFAYYVNGFLNFPEEVF